MNTFNPHYHPIITLYQSNYYVWEIQRGIHLEKNLNRRGSGRYCRKISYWSIPSYADLLEIKFKSYFKARQFLVAIDGHKIDMRGGLYVYSRNPYAKTEEGVG